MFWMAMLYEQIHQNRLLFCKPPLRTNLYFQPSHKIIVPYAIHSYIIMNLEYASKDDVGNYSGLYTTFPHTHTPDTDALDMFMV